MSAFELPIYPGDAIFKVDAGLRSAEFACDLAVCKGACCTMPGPSGAPLLEQEIPELERVFSAVEKYLPEVARKEIAQVGTWQRESDGTYTVPVINNRDCVFVTYDGDVAHCAIEKAYRTGEIDWMKPLSCHLFPIRIYPLSDGEFEIVYEEIEECAGGRARGKRERIKLKTFLDGPLARAIGPERLSQLRQLLSDETN